VTSNDGNLSALNTGFLADGTPIPISTLTKRNPDFPHGKIMGRSWEDHGKIMGMRSHQPECPYKFHGNGVC